MENLQQFMASLSVPSAEEASESFDKQSLLQLHELARQKFGNVPEGIFQTALSFTDPIGSSGQASSVPLERLRPISFTKLQVDQVHRRQVLYGTICAEAFRVSGIMTMLEDDHGLGVRLAIYNVAHSKTNIQRLYPRGAKVAIRDPYFKRAADNSLVIRVDNPANIEMLVTQNEQRQKESLQHVEVEELRKKGNDCFRENEWDSAAEFYTKCIEAGLLQLKNCSLNDNNDINTSLLHAYSNRAETRLRMKEFDLALEDSDHVLGIDSGNIKALYRKGRSLVGLRQYAEACKCLEKANKASHGQFEIQDALRQAKTLYSQSRTGKYDISEFLLRRESSIPEVADFVGPVEIRMTKDGRGRGLYAKREITTGQLLLVSNAVAVAYKDDLVGRIHVDPRGNINLTSQEELVAAVVGAARKSQRLLEQLYSLNYHSAPRNMDVPAIDLFKTEGHIAAGKEKLHVDVNRLRDIISRNSFGGGGVTFASKSKMFEAKIVQGGLDFTGLWLLPSFINHSCLPNSSRMEVGSAMFIHACKPIKRGEEITISYFDTLVPLLQRQALCENWGFRCNCRRCILELSLKETLEPISRRFEELHEKALEESNAARSLEGCDADLPACAVFANLFVEAEKIIKNSSLAQEKSNWIRASFLPAYLAGTQQSNDFFPTLLSDCVPSGQEVMESIQNTVPGDIRTLVMASRYLPYPVKESKQALDACIRVFGRQTKDVLQALFLDIEVSYRQTIERS